MQKKYIIRLNEEEREQLAKIIRKLKGLSQKVRRAQLFLKVDADGPAWTNAQIADAYNCRTKTVENLRQRFVEFGFEQTLDGKPRIEPAVPKCLDGDSGLRQSQHAHQGSVLHCL